jgi:Arc/MetJ family transcription regulator
MRTNIEIDDELMKRAMQVTGLRTKKATVEEALRRLVQRKRQSDLLDLFGKVEWVGDLDEMRQGRDFGIIDVPERPE